MVSRESLCTYKLVLVFARSVFRPFHRTPRCETGRMKTKVRAFPSPVRIRRVVYISLLACLLAWHFVPRSSSAPPPQKKIESTKITTIYVRPFFRLMGLS